MGKPKQGKTALKLDSAGKKELLGKAVRYIGVLGKTFVCPTCGRSGSRMIIWEHNNKSYCSRGCIQVTDS